MAAGIQHVQATQLIKISSPARRHGCIERHKNGRTLTLNVVRVLGQVCGVRSGRSPLQGPQYRTRDPGVREPPGKDLPLAQSMMATR